MKSIIQDENDRKCFLCSSTRNLEMHHIFNGNPMRQKSEDFGAKVWLCRRCHEDIHRDNLKRNALKGFVTKTIYEVKKCLIVQ